MAWLLTCVLSLRLDLTKTRDSFALNLESQRKQATFLILKGNQALGAIKQLSVWSASEHLSHWESHRSMRQTNCLTTVRYPNLQKINLRII